PPPTTMPAVRGRGATRSPANTAAMRRLERPRDRLRSRDAPRAEGPAPARIPGNPGTTERSQLHPRPTPRPGTPPNVRRPPPPAGTAACARADGRPERLRPRDAPRAGGPPPARIPGTPGTTERSQLHPRPTPRPDTPAIVRRHTPRSPPPPTTPPTPMRPPPR